MLSFSIKNIQFLTQNLFLCFFLQKISETTDSFKIDWKSSTRDILKETSLSNAERQKYFYNHEFEARLAKDKASHDESLLKIEKDRASLASELQTIDKDRTRLVANLEYMGKKRAAEKQKVVWLLNILSKAKNLANAEMKDFLGKKCIYLFI